MVDASLLEEVADFIVVDETEDKEKIVTPLILAAQNYLTNAGVKVSIENETYKLVIKLIVCQMFENRIGGDTDKNPSYCLSVQSLLTQLAYLGDNV